jgi:predicted transcriptional regulator
MKQKICHWCLGTGNERDQLTEGRQLRERRERAGRSLTEVAQMADLDKSMLCRIERGNRRATVKIMKLYASLKPRK